jgi:hypothetical protein
MLIRSRPASRPARLPKVAVCVLALLAVSGCATTQSAQQIDRLESVRENPRVVLMPPDIRYYLLTAGGVAEPNAEWTDAARANFTVAMQDYAASIGTELTLIDANNMSAQEIQYETLHSAVGLTILQNHFGMLKLPAKGGSFDWSLGPDVKSIAEEHDADYALFVYYRDYQASGGRVAFAVLAAAAGAAVVTGSESGFASLVDLRDGEIVWFNVVNAGSGEMRDRNGAATAVKTLFKDIPVAGGDAG